MGPRKYSITILLIISFISNSILAQCPQAFLKYSTEFSLTTIKVEKLETNVAIAWQLKYWPRHHPIDVIVTDSIFVDDIVLDQLIASTDYIIFVRNICQEETGEWNGPFEERTLIPSDSECSIDLLIEDNMCPTGEEFAIQIEGYDNEILGEDIFLSNIKIIISHDWPSDLRLSLVSPDGVEVDLSKDIGINQDNYGNPNEGNCQKNIRFDMTACQNINEIDNSMTGAYIPLGDFQDYHTGISPNGIWKLKICDKAIGDIGFLTYVKLKFSSMICAVPYNIGVSELSDTSFVVNWDIDGIYNKVIIESGPKGFIPGTGNSIALDFGIKSYNIVNLLEDTDYDFILYTDCGSSKSPISCRNSVKTHCELATIKSFFDNETSCIQSCSAKCFVQDNIWHNIEEDDEMDWIVNNNETPTEFTGPQSDILLTGNYLYIENNSTLCESGSVAILESSCIMISSNETSCHMDFYYHMNGDDITTLDLLLSTNNFSTWDTIFSKQGSQGSKWNRAIPNLSSYHNQAVSFRFVSKSGFGEKNDIAIDNISFYGSEILNESLIYYLDADEDGFGNENIRIKSCNTIAPVGYSVNSTDCDDSNPMVFPGAQEIHCNLIDENCNGMEDDQPLENPIDYNIIDADNVFCDGFEDGFILIQASGGNPPYQYLWNTGIDSKLIENIGTGTYICTITDDDNCKFVTDQIHVSVGNKFNPKFTVISPSCIGKEDGTIKFTHDGIPPYTYLWSTGATDSLVLENIKAGTYWVEISNNQCSERDTIIVESVQRILFTTEVNDISCHGDSDGSIELFPFTGKSPFTYDWNNNLHSKYIKDLPFGGYQCTIEDANGCTNIIDTIMINQPDSMIVRIDDLDHVVCNGQYNGYIKVSATGGTGPYNYKWNNNTETNYRDSLNAGFYFVSISDNNGCTSNPLAIEIIEKPIINITIDSIHPVSCPNSFDGYLSIEVDGGAGGYHYFWHELNAKDTVALTNLKNATYRLRVVDEFGCKTSFEADVPLINLPLEIDFILDNPNKCSGDDNAIIYSTVSTGTMPYQFHWNNGQLTDTNNSSDSIVQLSSGYYQITITDSEGCLAISDSININKLLQLNYTLTSWSDPSCYNINDGYLEIDAIGGTGPYDIKWSNNQSGEKIENLSGGNYSFSLTDGNDCSIESLSFELVEPEMIMVNINIDHNTTTEKSSITIQASSGNAPYIYKWSDGYIDTGYVSTRLQLDLQSYDIIITDDNGCTVDTTITVDDIVSIDAFNNKFGLNLFPNPSNGEFQIEVISNNTLNDYKIEIKNILGQTIYRDLIDTENNYFNSTIHLSVDQQGCMFVSISDADNTVRYFGKLIVL